MIEPSHHEPTGQGAPAPSAQHESQGATAPTDPVCGMKVDVSKGPSLSAGGVTYGFCSEHCLRTFQANPAQYTRGSAATSKPPPEALPEGTTYTCPMHPQ